MKIEPQNMSESKIAHTKGWCILKHLWEQKCVSECTLPYDLLVGASWAQHLSCSDPVRLSKPVSLCDHKSLSAALSCGVPQGSVLVTLLFCYLFPLGSKRQWMELLMTPAEKNKTKQQNNLWTRNNLQLIKISFSRMQHMYDKID